MSLAALLNPFMIDTGNTVEAMSLQQHPRACVTTDCPNAWMEVAQRIANELKVPYIPIDQEMDDSFQFSHVLDVIAYGDTYALGIRPIFSQQSSSHSSVNQLRRQRQHQQRERGKEPGFAVRRKVGSPTPYVVDFCPSHNSRIAQRIKSGSDMLIKAVAPKKVAGGARILDMTAGFGQDSFLLLENGASMVHMVERDVIVASLLRDALRRRRQALSMSDDSVDNLSLLVGHGADIARSHPDPVHVCYLDPMFPPRTKSAAVKKNMQILHSLLESQHESILEDDPVQLLESALAVAQKRVVVKRPIHAPPLGRTHSTLAPKPTFDVSGTVNRFDIYIF